MDAHLKLLKKHKKLLLDILETKAKKYLFAHHRYHSREFLYKAENTQELISALKEILNETK